MNEKNAFALVPRSPSALEKAEPGAKRILSGMVSDALDLAKNLATEEVKVTDAQSEKWWRTGLKYVPKDYAEAVKWYRRAAEGNHALAQRSLGICYEGGQGVEKDCVEAVKWYRKAAQQNVAGAQFSLGSCYEDGRGVEKDHVEALKWYRKAAEQNDETAQLWLGHCYAEGIGVEKDHVEAVKRFRECAEQYDDAWAKYFLGGCYENGRGVEMNYDEAAKWYRKAAEADVAEAQYSLARCYEEGRGVEKDYAQAVEWYHTAAYNGHEAAHENLHVYYANDRAAIDIAGAVYDYTYMRLAKDKGYAGAAKTVAMIEALLSSEEFSEAERHYREFCSRTQTRET